MKKCITRDLNPRRKSGTGLGALKDALWTEQQRRSFFIINFNGQSLLVSAKHFGRIFSSKDPFLRI